MNQGSFTEVPVEMVLRKFAVLYKPVLKPYILKLLLIFSILLIFFFIFNNKLQIQKEKKEEKVGNFRFSSSQFVIKHSLYKLPCAVHGHSSCSCLACFDLEAPKKMTESSQGNIPLYLLLSAVLGVWIFVAISACVQITDSELHCQVHLE